MPPAPRVKPGDNGSAPPGLDQPPDPAGATVLTIVKGSPSAEEIAAVVVAVAAARNGPASGARAAGRIRSEWSSRSRLARQPLARGPGGWRASALPR
jgi:Acyl-CoA carboxylase epsilon subunit